MAAFLVDANLSVRLAAVVAGVFPGTTHVGLVGLASASDVEIWVYARRAGLMILSKDSDFRHLSLTFGAPPRFVWLRAGNCTTDQAANIVLAARRRIDEFESDGSAAMLVIGG